ncbi:hypothetical protein ID866_5299 [Astraeus odoratus]|nr:hypothetical protein ID866_5299 [Astraeus odoratus]
MAEVEDTQLLEIDVVGAGEPVTVEESDTLVADDLAPGAAKKLGVGNSVAPVVRDRETGKSVLPFSRVQKIIKADKDLPIVARDATLLISLATEEFIKRLAEACQKAAERERRTTVQQKDIASVVRRAEEFFFLDEIISSHQRGEPLAKRKPKALEAEQSTPDEPTVLDKFMKKPSREDESTDVVMNEDGAMYAS